jgi:hypothetical protein
MPVSELSAIERIARVLAAQRFSINGHGDEVSASEDVDERWYAYQDDAVAVLRTLREPDVVMADAGDPEIWRRMVEAALQDFGS